MKLRRDALSRYLEGELSIDEGRSSIASGGGLLRDKLSELLEFDYACRQRLSGFKAPHGAANDLSELASDPRSYEIPRPDTDGETPGLRLKNNLEFDVFGAEASPKTIVRDRKDISRKSVKRVPDSTKARD
jgi:hypothetical protein